MVNVRCDYDIYVYIYIYATPNSKHYNYIDLLMFFIWGSLLILLYVLSMLNFDVDHPKV